MTSYCEPVSARTDWATPQWLFDLLDEEFHFTLDVCASADNAKCEAYYSQSALDQRWRGICWMNPPYGKEISKWVTHAWAAAKRGNATVVCLLPARSNCDWWRFVIEGEVRFIRKKLQFEGASGVSMFPNVIVVFRPMLQGGGTMRIWEPKKPQR